MVSRLYGDRRGHDFGLCGHLYVGDAAPGDRADPGKQHGGIAGFWRQPDWLLPAARQRDGQFGRIGGLRCVGRGRPDRPDLDFLPRPSARSQNIGTDREGRISQRAMAWGRLIGRRYPKRRRHDELMENA